MLFRSVVDAGGQGLCLIFEGMLSVFRSGIVLDGGLSPEEKAEETAQFFRNVAAEFDSEINFTYCTEFVVGRDPEVQKDPLELRLKNVLQNGDVGITGEIMQTMAVKECLEAAAANIGWKDLPDR